MLCLQISLSYNLFDTQFFLMQVSITSEQDNSFTLPQDDNSNDALVIVDDDSNWSMNDSNSGRLSTTDGI